MLRCTIEHQFSYFTMRLVKQNKLAPTPLYLKTLDNHKKKTMNLAREYQIKLKCLNDKKLRQQKQEVIDKNSKVIIDKRLANSIGITSQLKETTAFLFKSLSEIALETNQELLRKNKEQTEEATIIYSEGEQYSKLHKKIQNKRTETAQGLTVFSSQLLCLYKSTNYERMTLKQYDDTINSFIKLAKELFSNVTISLELKQHQNSQCYLYFVQVSKSFQCIANKVFFDDTQASKILEQTIASFMENLRKVVAVCDAPQLWKNE